MPISKLWPEMLPSALIFFQLLKLFFFKRADTLSRKKTIVRKTPQSTGGTHRRARKLLVEPRKLRVKPYNACKYEQYKPWSVKGRQRTPRTRDFFYRQMHGFLYRHMGTFKEP